MWHRQTYREITRPEIRKIQSLVLLLDSHITLEKHFTYRGLWFLTYKLDL